MKINKGLLPRRKILYNNETGSAENITLNETVANFKYIEIFYKGSFDTYSSVKIYEPDGKVANLSMNEEEQTATYEVVYTKLKRANISGNLITVSGSQAWTGTTTGFAQGNTYILITKIIGYY